MDTNKMFLVRKDKDSEPISLRSKHSDAESDAKRAGLEKFEVVPVVVEIRELSTEELVNGQ